MPIFDAFRKPFKDDSIPESQHETMEQTQKRIKKQIARGNNNPNATDFEKGLAAADRAARLEADSWENSIYNPNRVIEKPKRDLTNLNLVGSITCDFIEKSNS